jgi:rSAM/selenodomain-associated transferase 1
VSATLIVIAKAPVAGRVKTRLCPPCTPAQAAALAEASLRDTLHAASRTPATRRVVCLDGAPGSWLPAGFEVIAQRGEGLAERLAAAFEDAGGPAFLIGMDTPQVRPEWLEAGLRAAAHGEAVLGASLDGGYWGIGLRRPDPGVFAGVPMSSPRTGAIQRARLATLGLATATLRPLLDVDTFADALKVAREAPGTTFAAALAELELEVAA